MHIHLSVVLLFHFFVLEAHLFFKHGNFVIQFVNLRFVISLPSLVLDCLFFNYNFSWFLCWKWFFFFFLYLHSFRDKCSNRTIFASLFTLSNQSLLKRLSDFLVFVLDLLWLLLLLLSPLLKLLFTLLLLELLLFHFLSAGLFLSDVTVPHLELIVFLVLLGLLPDSLPIRNICSNTLFPSVGLAH